MAVLPPNIHSSPPPTPSHSVIFPAILYWGTPVVLITTTNSDGTPNIGPMSSAFWLGNRCMLGLASSSQTTVNLLRTRQCVLNLASDDMIGPVNALARTTGTPDPPAFKTSLGYRFVKDKFGVAGLHPSPSSLVSPPRIQECQVQMEAEMVGTHEMMADLASELKGFTLAVEVRVLRTHVLDWLRLEGHENRVDPDRWRPLIMSFQQLYGLGDRKEESALAGIEEESYRALVEEGKAS